MFCGTVRAGEGGLLESERGGGYIETLATKMSRNPHAPSEQYSLLAGWTALPCGSQLDDSVAEMIGWAEKVDRSVPSGLKEARHPRGPSGESTMATDTIVHTPRVSMPQPKQMSAVKRTLHALHSSCSPSRRLSLPGSSFGWVYPEHREIMFSGPFSGFQPQDSVTLAMLWAYARTGHESRLSVLPADTADSIDPATIDLAAWPAISGDHSCSPANMLHNVLETDWILDVAGVTAKLSRDLAAAGLERYKRTNALRDSDLRLQRADPEYITRAGANNVHFLLARPNAETDQQTYVELCLASGVELNALGAYAWYHLSALRKAQKAVRG